MMILLPFLVLVFVLHKWIVLVVSGKEIDI